jgi:3-dehydroquinate dehydratase-1
MTRPKTTFRTDRHHLLAGKSPLVAGVLCSLRGKFPPAGRTPACDLVEVRLDITGRPAGWLEKCRAIQDAGWPVLLTIRLAVEGGRWKNDDTKRFRVYEEGLAAIAAVDVEWRSPFARPVAARAKELGKLCVVSFHDFDKTPPAQELAAIIKAARKFADIVKISTRLNNPAEEKILRSLLGKKWNVPLCVIGMGPEYAHTRVEFPRLGSCLAYGYLDHPTAPGQLSAAELTNLLGKAPRKTAKGA